MQTSSPSPLPAAPDALDLVKEDRERRFLWKCDGKLHRVPEFHYGDYPPLDQAPSKKMSRQQQEVLNVIAAAGERGITTMDLIRLSGVCDAPRRARELRRMGKVEAPVYEGRTPSGSSVFRYRAVKSTTNNQGA